MLFPPSKIGAFFDANPPSADVFKGILAERDEYQGYDGAKLVHHMSQLIKFVFEEIRQEIVPSELSRAALVHYVNQLSVFARYNSQFLKSAADHTADAVPELAHEFTRNFLEEGGNTEIPAHYILYSSALLRDLDVNIVGQLPLACTTALVQLVDLLSRSHCPSIICGALYATEGVAISETELLRDITDALAVLSGKKGTELPKMKYYYDLHLDHGVEQGHMDGIARFIRQYRDYGLKLPQICDGFLQGMEAMAMWWTQLHVDAQQLRPQGVLKTQRKSA